MQALLLCWRLALSRGSLLGSRVLLLLLGRLSHRWATSHRRTRVVLCWAACCVKAVHQGSRYGPASVLMHVCLCCTAPLWWTWLLASTPSKVRAFARVVHVLAGLAMLRAS